MTPVRGRGVHRAAAQGFGQQRSVAAYERARPTFPGEAVAFLARALDLSAGSRVADLGAGTGKLTRLLTDRGTRVVAVEPVAEMRAGFRAVLPEVPVVGATAEELPFADGSLDAVTAAQAFHWFDGPRALTAIHRVLRPGGRLGLVWNSRDERAGWVAALSELIEPFRGDAPGQATLAWKRAFDGEERFDPLDHAEFAHGHELGVAGVVDRIASISFVAAMGDEERAGLLDAVRALAAEQPRPVVLPYVTHVYWTRRLG